MSKTKPPGDYEVGRGRPPIEHRWKKGMSGNPSGRKKKQDTIADTLKAKLGVRIKVGESGRHKSMTMQELILEQLIRDAAKSDPRARSLLFALISRYEGTDETLIDAKNLSREDQDLIETFIANQASGDQNIAVVGHSGTGIATQCVESSGGIP